MVDDGSKDNTKQVIEQLGDARIKYHWQTNQERSAARNNGIKLAAGNYICLLDSDDIWRNNHLQALYNAIKQYGEQPAAYFTGMCWNFPDRKQDVVFPEMEGSTVEYVIKNQLAPSTTCFHKVILEKYNFALDLRINEDVELFARIAAEYPFIRVPEVTVDFMIHAENTKALEKDIITPQIVAMKRIFGNPSVSPHVSAAFRKEIFRVLSHQLINHYNNTGQFGKMNREILTYLSKFPFDVQNKSRIVLLLYHLPGGGFLKNIVARTKSK